MYDSDSEDFEETVVGLYRMSEWVLSLLQDNRYGKKQVASLALAYAKISDALELLCGYEQASEDDQPDLAHEYGMNYSNLMADLQEKLDELHDDGIVMRLQ